jgi:hypothetical protein
MRRLAAVALTVLLPTAAFADKASEEAAADLLRKRMKTERPEDLTILDSVAGKAIVVVRGSMDHIEQVLDAANIRHTLISPEEVAAYDFHADMIVMVNCPGRIPAKGVERIERFVRAGGLLYSTDWALLNLIQKAFPRTIAHNGKSTGDHVTPVQVVQKDDNLMSKMLLKHDAEPQWWLEGGSYPIRIIDKTRVRVLASSREMGTKYDGAPVVVRFRWDDGEVIHVVSHFYRQIQTRGPAVAMKNALDGVSGLTKEQAGELKNSPKGNVNFEDVSSSYAFQQMTSNMVVEKQKDNVELDKKYDATPAAPSVTVGGRQVKKGERLKVLKRSGAKVVVRDDRGNEGEIDAEAVEAR